MSAVLLQDASALKINAVSQLSPLFEFLASINDYEQRPEFRQAGCRSQFLLVELFVCFTIYKSEFTNRQEAEQFEQQISQCLDERQVIQLLHSSPVWQQL